MFRSTVKPLEKSTSSKGKKAENRSQVKLGSETPA